MKFSKKELYNKIKSNATHIYVEYNNKEGVIDPLNENEIILGFGEEETITTLKDVMSLKFWDGKSLNEICEDVEFEY
jgi:hypothetical protein